MARKIQSRESIGKNYHFKEIQWQRRGGVKWILKGDSNNGHFHGMSNNRKKKCTIFSLENGESEIKDPKEIRNHVEDYYKNLFGLELDGSISLGEEFWKEEGRLSEEEAQELIKPTLNELEGALKHMDVNSAFGPDGLPVGFYREFWHNIKYLILEMFPEFYRGELNLSRMNYKMISLMPKLKEVNNIKQYRPICLLNVDYKWFTKVLTMRLTPYAGKLISDTHTAFIPGRYILEGEVVLHAILHEIRVKKLKGIILKLNFEKAYDKVH
jgi:hypothetical protein